MHWWTGQNYSSEDRTRRFLCTSHYGSNCPSHVWFWCWFKLGTDSTGAPETERNEFGSSQDVFSAGLLSHRRSRAIQKMQSLSQGAILLGRVPEKPLVCDPQGIVSAPKKKVIKNQCWLDWRSHCNGRRRSFLSFYFCRIGLLRRALGCIALSRLLYL